MVDTERVVCYHWLAFQARASILSIHLGDHTHVHMSDCLSNAGRGMPGGLIKEMMSYRVPAM